MFVPAHVDASADVKGLVRYNRDKVHEVADRILSVCGKPMYFERILQEVFKGYELTMNFEQYVLVGAQCGLASHEFRQCLGGDAA